MTSVAQRGDQSPGPWSAIHLSVRERDVVDRPSHPSSFRLREIATARSAAEYVSVLEGI